MTSQFSLLIILILLLIMIIGLFFFKPREQFKPTAFNSDNYQKNGSMPVYFEKETENLKTLFSSIVEPPPQNIKQNENYKHIINWDKTDDDIVITYIIDKLSEKNPNNKNYVFVDFLSKSKQQINRELMLYDVQIIFREETINEPVVFDETNIIYNKKNYIGYFQISKSRDISQTIKIIKARFDGYDFSHIYTNPTDKLNNDLFLIYQSSGKIINEIKKK